MSQFGPWGRGTPRWSLATAQAAFGMASTAGLVATMAMVSVDPPLCCSGPSLGSTLILSFSFFVRVQSAEGFWIRLWPSESTFPKQSDPTPCTVLSARIVAAGLMVPEPSTNTPPPDIGKLCVPVPATLFAATVASVSTRGDRNVSIPPPNDLIEPDPVSFAVTVLFAIVEFVIAPSSDWLVSHRLPPRARAMPSAVVARAVFRLTVEPTIEADPDAHMPPPPALESSGPAPAATWLRSTEDLTSERCAGAV